MGQWPARELSALRLAFSDSLAVSKAASEPAWLYDALLDGVDLTDFVDLTDPVGGRLFSDVLLTSSASDFWLCSSASILAIALPEFCQSPKSRTEGRRLTSWPSLASASARCVSARSSSHLRNHFSSFSHLPGTHATLGRIATKRAKPKISVRREVLDVERNEADTTRGEHSYPTSGNLPTKSHQSCRDLQA